jgi:lysophospholipase L1-like esterase
MTSVPKQIEPAPETGATTSAGPRKLALAVATVLCLALLTYLVPFLGRFRPWVAGESVPVLRYFTRQQLESFPVFAEAGSFTGGAVTGRGRVAEVVGEAVAANLEKTDRSGRPAGVGSPAPAGAGPGAGGSGRDRVSPGELEGVGQPIEDDGGAALAPFYRALWKTARGQPGAITRVAHYGDSAVASDVITHTVRKRMQERFGDSGHGFLLVARGDMHYRHHGVRHRASDDWELFHAVKRSLGESWYGYGAVQYRGSAGANAFFATAKEGTVGRRVSRFEIFYQRYPRGGNLRIRVDGKRVKTLDTRGEQPEDAWESIEVPDGEHSLSISAGGRGIVRLYGVALERDVPGVVYDSLGLVGGRAERLLNSDPEHMKRQLGHRDLALVILAFGGNEAGNKWLDLDRYHRELTRVVRHMRGSKPLPCLLFAPLDQGERDERGKVHTLPKLPGVVEVQRRVAREQKCGFFDAYAAMGGEGSIGRWYRSRPRLATDDFRHATPAGYKVLGNMFYKALLKGFADHVQRRGGRAPAVK